MYISKGDKTSAGWKTEKINNEVAEDINFNQI